MPSRGTNFGPPAAGPHYDPAHSGFAGGRAYDDCEVRLGGGRAEERRAS